MARASAPALPLPGSCRTHVGKERDPSPARAPRERWSGMGGKHVSDAVLMQDKPSPICSPPSTSSGSSSHPTHAPPAVVQGRPELGLHQQVTRANPGHSAQSSPLKRSIFPPSWCPNPDVPCSLFALQSVLTWALQESTGDKNPELPVSYSPFESRKCHCAHPNMHLHIPTLHTLAPTNPTHPHCMLLASVPQDPSLVTPRCSVSPAQCPPYPL